MYKYIANSTSILRLADGAVIPDAPGNADWQIYQAWIAANNTPEPADPEPTEHANAAALFSIATLEKKQARALREMALGINTATAQTKLEEYEQQIVVLRSQLQS